MAGVCFYLDAIQSPVTKVQGSAPVVPSRSCCLTLDPRQPENLSFFIEFISWIP